MKETYSLNSDPLPKPPVPHDCVIQKLEIRDSFLRITFEDGISRHDAIKYLNPEAKSLIMRFHLPDDPDDRDNLLIRLESPVRFRRQQCRILDISQLEKLTKDNSRLEYIDHYASCSTNSLIIILGGSSTVHMEMTTDFIEYDWIL